MILQLGSSIIADKISTRVKNDQSWNPVDSIALLQVLDSLFISIRYGSEGHLGKVSLKSCFIPVVRAEDYLNSLLPR